MSTKLLQKNIEDMKKRWGWQANFASKTQISPVHPEILDDQIEFFIQSHISMKEEEIKYWKGKIKKSTYDNPKTFAGEHGTVLSNRNQTNEGYNQAIQDIISHIKKELSEYKDLIK